jgi:hypothetical protein
MSKAMNTTPDCSHWRQVIRTRSVEGLAGEEAARVETHLAGCAECRRYANELRAATGGLRWLASREVEPSAGFRACWTRAVAEAAPPGSPGDSVTALLDWCREAWRRNWRPALAMACLWLLALMFRLSAPGVASPAAATVARSPVEIARALDADQNLVAWHPRRSDPLPPAPRPTQPSQPRSQLPPAQPAAQFDLLPHTHATVSLMLPARTVRRSSAGSLPV